MDQAVATTETALMEIFDDIEQGTPEWKALKAGVPSCSEFSSILAKGEGKTRRAYMLKLAGERITGEFEEGFKSPAMALGNLLEDEARLKYQLLTGKEVRRVAFIKNHGAGYSPDSLIDDDGALEIKIAKPSVLIPLLDKGAFPPEHVPQCQGGLWVSGRAWVTIFVYWPKMPALMVTAYRDAAKIGEIAREVRSFQDDLDALVTRIKGFGS